MFVRIRWFLAGVVAAFGGLGFIVAQMRKARQRLTAANLVAVGKRRAAVWLDSVAQRVAPEQAGPRRR